MGRRMSKDKKTLKYMLTLSRGRMYIGPAASPQGDIGSRIKFYANRYLDLVYEYRILLGQKDYIAANKIGHSITKCLTRINQIRQRHWFWQEISRP